MKIFKIIIPVILFIPLLFAGCGSNNKTEQTNTSGKIKNVVTLTDAQYKNAGITVGKLEQRTISNILKVNGKIDVPPQNMVSVSVPLGGYLKSTKLLPGMHVSDGEVIAVMEDQQYIQLKQDYLTAKAKLDFSTHEFERQKELNLSKASSDKIFQQSEANYITEKISVKALSEKLKLIGINPEMLNENTISKSINIYSPINGYVSKVNVNIGKYTQPSEVLFELVNPTDIHLNLTIFEKDMDKIWIGQKVMAYTNNMPSKKHPCEIILIGKNMSKERNAEVHCHFENYDKTLLPGMYMNAEIEVGNNNALVIPNDGLVRFEEKQYVFIHNADNEYHMQEVNTINSENGFTQIAFQDGAELQNKIFVTKGAYSLLMKLKNTAEE